MNYVLKAVLLTCVAVMMVSCSSGNPNSDSSIFDPATGKHVAGWAVAATGGAHPAAFLANFTLCFECHGTDLKGSTSTVSCFTASRSGIQCHGANGPRPHGLPFPDHGPDFISKTARFCLTCHQDAVTAAGLKPPGCRNCHLTSPVATPGGCTSCHAKPPNSAIFPNISGRHAIHAGLNVAQNPTLTAACDECHSGLGLGTVDHLDRSRVRTSSPLSPVAFGPLASKDLLLPPTYNVATKQCLNTYCHGNSLPSNNLNPDPRLKLSPVWTERFLTGVAANDCTKCHGYPPLTGSHPVQGPALCHNCHHHVNATDDGFIDPTLHINGRVDVFN